MSIKVDEPIDLAFLALPLMVLGMLVGVTALFLQSFNGPHLYHIEIDCMRAMVVLIVLSGLLMFSGLVWEILS